MNKILWKTKVKKELNKNLTNIISLQIRGIIILIAFNCRSRHDSYNFAILLINVTIINYRNSTIFLNHGGRGSSRKIEEIL